MQLGRRHCPELLLAWLALPLLLSACAAPVVLERALGASAIRIYGSTAAFEGREEAIVDTLADALRIASELLATGKVDIGVEFEVYLDGRGAIEGWGVGGYTPDAHRVRLWIDPGASEVPDLLSRRLAWIALHELHHAIRWRGPGYGRTLVEALVSEGLADHFALQCIGEPAPPWTAALFSEQATRFRRSAAALGSAEGYNHDEWFFGSGSLPRWVGYTLGFERVAAHLAAHPAASAASLVDAPAEAFASPALE
jgi:uncharacterized protein YjaZ